VLNSAALLILRNDTVKFLAFNEIVLDVVCSCNAENGVGNSGLYNDLKQTYLNSHALAGSVEYTLRKGEEVVGEIIRLIQQQQQIKQTMSSDTSPTSPNDGASAALANVSASISRVVPVFHACLSFLIRCWACFPSVIEEHDDIVNNTLAIIRFFFSLPITEILTAAVSIKMLYLFQSLLESNDEYSVVIYKHIITLITCPSSSSNSMVNANIPELIPGASAAQTSSSSSVPEYSREPIYITSTLNQLSPFVMGIISLIHLYPPVPNSSSNSPYPLLNHYLCYDEILSRFALILARFQHVPVNPIVDILRRRWVVVFLFYLLYFILIFFLHVYMF
jgi:hypothetical protein